MVVVRMMSMLVLTLVGPMLTAAASEPRGAVPRSTQTSMGFGSAATLSDSDGLHVRGKGSRAIVWGTGYGVIVRPHLAIGAGAGKGTSFVFSFGYAK